MERHLIEIPAGKLSFVESGSGETALVFLHYWGGTSRTYQPVMQRLSDDFRCIAFDQRGWGESSRDGDFSLAAYAEDTVALIEGLGLRRYVLVGHSMGGKVAQLVAARRPEGLASLVLLAPAPAKAFSVPETQRQMMLDSYQSEQGVGMALQILAKRKLEERFRRQVVEDTLGGALEAKRNWTEDGMLSDLSPAAQGIEVPAVVIVGSDDLVEVPDRLREEMPKTIPHIRFDILPGLGHLAPLEDAESVAAAIRRFLAGQTI